MARFLLALAAMAAADGAARAQEEVPAVISPLRFESDRNGVNLIDGRTVMELPALSVPGAPNLRFDRLQNVAPYVKGTVQTPLGAEIDQRRYSIHTGTGASDSFQCENYVCTSVTGTGSTFRYAGRRYQQSGSGAVWTFNLLHSSTASSQSPYQTMMYYASAVTYPNGEVITYSYTTATLNGDPIPGRVFYRPATITSNLGYYISLTFAGGDFNGDMTAWGTLTQAAIYSSANPGTPLGRLTYSGSTITDLGGRVYTCSGCNNALGTDIEVSAGSMQLPGEASPARQVAPVTSVPQSAARPVGSVTQDGVQWSYSYDNLHFQNPLTTTNGYLYDHLTVTGPNGYHTVYDVAQRPIFMSTIQQNVITRVTDSIGRSTSYEFDASYRPTRVTYPEQNRIDVIYDEYGNVTQRITAPKPNGGSPITQAASYPSATCAPDNTSTALCWRPTWSRDGMQRQTDYAYNALGQLTEQIDPADANGVRRRTSISYAIAGGVSRRSAVRICADTGASCGTNAPIQTEYDYAGPVLLPTAERRIDAAAGVTLTTSYSYDAAGRLLSTDGPLPGSDDSIYNRYDVHGRRTWEIGPRAPNGLRIARRHEYRASDDKPVLTETGTIPDENSFALAVQTRTDIAYDGRRNPVREAVSAGGTTHSVLDRSFDDQGRLECEAQRMNPAAFGQTPGACALTTVDAAYGPDRITRNLYDAAGQLLQVQRAYLTASQQNYATYTYSLNGQRLSLADANGNRAEMTYDGHDRQRRWIFPSATVAGAANPNDFEEYGYDAAGNRTSLRKRDGTVLAYQYDNLNRLTLKTVPASVGGAPGYGVHYGHDLQGLQLFARFGSPAGPGITNIYDGFGRLSSSSTNMDGAARTVSYTYDARGNKTGISGNFGYFTGAAYDAADRMTSLIDGSGTMMRMSYDAAGRRSAMDSAFTAWTSYAYDPIGRLSGLSHDFAGTAGDQSFGFAHNPASQITQRSRSNDAYASNTAYAVNRAYSVNGLNQYTAAGPAAFAYDANGNLTSDGSRTFVYDAENRLVGASGGVSLAYDPLGRLWQVSGPSGTTRFTYDGDHPIWETDGAGNFLRAYAHGPGADEPLIAYDGTGGPFRRFLRADHQGSIVAAADDNGNILSINAYDEWGIPNAGNTGRFQYTGQMWLPELGMYHYKARVYSPTLGRFLQTDPVGYDDQVNLYAYVGNDPVNHTDPTGRYICEGSRMQCRAVRSAINRVAAAVRRGTLPRAQRALQQRVVERYGRDGDRNGIVVRFDTPERIYSASRGAAYTNYNERTGESHVVLPTNFPSAYNSFRSDMAALGRRSPSLSRFSAQDERGNMVADEGRHALDQQRLGRNLRPSEFHPQPDLRSAVSRAFGSASVQDINRELD